MSRRTSQPRPDGPPDQRESSPARHTRDYVAGGGLLLMAVAVRAWVSSNIPVVPQDAAGGYLPQARALLAGDWGAGLGTYFPPGYPMAVAAVAGAGIPLVAAAKAVSVVCGALLLLPIFGLARDLFDRRTAGAAAGMAALYPVLVLHSADAASEGLFTLLAVTALGLGYRWRHRSGVLRWSAFGGLWGLAYLVRGEGLVMFGLLAAVLFGLMLSGRLADESSPTRGIRRAVTCLLASAAGFLVPAVPYMVALRSATGQTQVSGKTMENLLAYDITDDGRPVDIESIRLGLAPGGQHLRMETERSRSVWEFMRDNGRRQVRRYLRNAARAYLQCLPHTLYPLYLLLLGVALFPVATDPGKGPALAYLGAFSLFPFLFYPIFLIEDRYFVTLAPVGLIGAARGLARLFPPGAPGSIRRRLPAVALLGLVAGHAWPIAEQVRGAAGEYPVEHRRAGEWLGAHDPSHPRIMNRKSYVAFYAGGISILTPTGELSEVLAYARAQKVDYLVIDERYTAPLRPSLRILLQDHGRPPELEPVYEARERPGTGIVIFRLRPEASLRSATPGGSGEPRG